MKATVLPRGTTSQSLIIKGYFKKSQISDLEKFGSFSFFCVTIQVDSVLMQPGNPVVSLPASADGRLPDVC